MTVPYLFRRRRFLFSLPLLVYNAPSPPPHIHFFPSSFSSLLFFLLLLFLVSTETLQIAYRPRVGSSLPRLIATLDPVRPRFQAFKTPWRFLGDIENIGMELILLGCFFSSSFFWIWFALWSRLRSRRGSELVYGYRDIEKLRGRGIVCIELFTFFNF